MRQGPYGGQWSYFRGHRGYLSDATMPVATTDRSQDSCLGLCGIHGNSLWHRGDVGHAAACQQVCTPYAVPQRTGPAHLGWFKSEFGCEVWSSFESMSAQLPPDQWSMDSAAAAQRNHNVSTIIGTFFGVDAVTRGMRQVGRAAFQRQLYQSMIAQLLNMKATIEAYRSSNGFGTIFCETQPIRMIAPLPAPDDDRCSTGQYNDIWPTVLTL